MLALRSDERLTVKLQLLNSLRWPIYVINSVDNTKLHRKGGDPLLLLIYELSVNECVGVNLSPTAIFSWMVVDFLCSALSSTAFASCVAPRTSPNWTSWLNRLLLPTVSWLRFSLAGAGLTWVTLKTIKNENV